MVEHALLQDIGHGHGHGHGHDGDESGRENRGRVLANELADRCVVGGRWVSLFIRLEPEPGELCEQPGYQR